MVGLRPVVFVPRTLWRAWGTRRDPAWIKKVEVCGPHLAKKERDAPNFLSAAPDKAACAPFCQGKAHEVCGTHELHRKSGVGGTRVRGRDRAYESRGRDRTRA